MLCSVGFHACHVQSGLSLDSESTAGNYELLEFSWK